MGDCIKEALVIHGVLSFIEPHIKGSLGGFSMRRQDFRQSGSAFVCALSLGLFSKAILVSSVGHRPVRVQDV